MDGCEDRQLRCCWPRFGNFYLKKKDDWRLLHSNGLVFECMYRCAGQTETYQIAAGNRNEQYPGEILI